jgi:hypothetical protein
MILLVTPSDRACDCAAALRNAAGEEVAIVESLTQATALLRAQSYSVVVLDLYLVETEPDAFGTMIEQLGMAIPVQVNLATSGMQRMVREVLSAVRRRQCEEAAARRAAIGKLQSELNGMVTALLLSTELAIEASDLPPATAEKLQSIHELVNHLRMQLETAAMDSVCDSRA